MVEVQMEPRVAAYLFTLLQIALGHSEIGRPLSPEVEAALRRVLSDIGDRLEPFDVQLRETVEAMWGGTEVVQVKEDAARVVH